MPETPTLWEKLFKLSPAVVRSFILTLVGLAASVGVVAIDDKQTSLIVNFVLAFFALGAGLVIKPAVTPNAKVVIRDETPLASVSTLVPGDAVPAAASNAEILDAAKVAA